jgi:hypothetical protein
MIAGGRDVVDSIEIAIPCKASWDAMVGDDRVRHCGDCRQNVYNIAAFSRAEAMRLLQQRSGRVCVRIFRRPDGTVITDDCRARLRAARKRGLLIFAGTLLIVAWAQICAQLVGLMGMRRLMSRGNTAGAAAPVAADAPPVGKPTPPVARPIPPEPMLPTMGAPPPPEPRRHKPRAKRDRHAGTEVTESKGKRKLPVIDDESMGLGDLR